MQRPFQKSLLVSRQQEIAPNVTNCNFRRLPQPRIAADEMQDMFPYSGALRFRNLFAGR